MYTIDPNTPVGDAETRIRCILADRHPVVSEGLAVLLPERQIEVAATASTGREALAAIDSHRPDVAVIDADLPDLTGVEVVRRLHELPSPVAAIVYADRAELPLLDEALDAGASGVALKESPVTDLMQAVRTAAAGQTFIDPVLGAQLVRPDTSAPQLSIREREILGLLAEGKSNGEIGLALHIAPDTVRTYISRAMSKLQARTRTHAVAVAIRHSLIG